MLAGLRRAVRRLGARGRPRPRARSPAGGAARYRARGARLRRPALLARARRRADGRGARRRAARARRRARGRARRRADELLERVGLLDRADAHPARALRRRAAARRALRRARAPAAAPARRRADRRARRRDAPRDVSSSLAELAREHGATALVVSHDPASAAIADRVVHVRDGRVSEERRAAAATTPIVVGRGGWLRVPEELLARGRDRRPGTRRLEPTGVVELAPVGEPVRHAPVAHGRRPSHGAARRARSRRARSTPALRRETPLDGLDARFAAGRLTRVTGPVRLRQDDAAAPARRARRARRGRGACSTASSLVGARPRRPRARFRRERIALVGQAAALSVPRRARERRARLALRGVDAGEARARARSTRSPRSASPSTPSGRSASSRPASASGSRSPAPSPHGRLLARRRADRPPRRRANALAVGTLLAELAREHGTTVVCATHDPLLIEQADEELALG